MVQSREERLKKKRESDKKYRENNKEKIAEMKREYRQNNKEHLAEKNKIYDKTPAGKKSKIMRSWRSAGVKNVNEKLYNDYIATTYCECCLKEFISSFDRCLDHDHETGEFRWVICRNCNSHDNWKKIIHSVSQY